MGFARRTGQTPVREMFRTFGVHLKSPANSLVWSERVIRPPRQSSRPMTVRVFNSVTENCYQSVPDEACTSSEVTWKEIKRALPNDVVIAQSVASRPVAIKTLPMRRTLCLASKVHQRSPR